MSVFEGRMYHPKGLFPEKNVYSGFSWACLICGPAWFAAKEMWSWCVVLSAIIVISYYVSLILSVVIWLIPPFFANSLWKSHLKKKGYKWLCLG